MIFMIYCISLGIGHSPVKSSISWTERVESKWTVRGVKVDESGRSYTKLDGIKLGGPKGLKVDGLRKWAVPKSKSGRS